MSNNGTTLEKWDNFQTDFCPIFSNPPVSVRLIFDVLFRYIDDEQHNDYYYLVMEHCEEGDLRSQLHKKNYYKQKFDVEQVIDWAFQIASALKFCHDRTVIHRDLKVKV